MLYMLQDLQREKWGDSYICFMLQDFPLRRSTFLLNIILQILSTNMTTKLLIVVTVKPQNHDFKTSLYLNSPLNSGIEDPCNYSSMLHGLTTLFMDVSNKHGLKPYMPAR